VNKRVGILLAAAVGFWAVAFLPARLLGGTTAVVYSLVALALCLTPALLTLLLASRQPSSSPQQTVLIVFGGTGLRMGCVLGGGLLLYTQVEYFQQIAFWFWLLVFYLYVLLVEVWLLRSSQTAAAG
jgi:hypothetical protein